MKLRKSKKVHEQIELANALKAGIVRMIRSKLSGHSPDDEHYSDWLSLMKYIELSAEAFDVELKECAAHLVNRTTSMLTGPFFTSAEFPIPSSETGMFFPVVQLELDELSAAAKQDLGDGLLQLWFDLATQTEQIRVIPLNKTSVDEMTPFEWKPPAPFDDFPLPHHWNLNPNGSQVPTIIELKSWGVQSQGSSIAAHLDNMGDELVSDWLRVLVKLFAANTPSKTVGAVSMLGTFYPIHYASSDVGMKCLINIADWGSTGGAQLFYETATKGAAAKFAFWNCIR